MSIWYAICDLLPIEMLQWDFMKNALLAVLLMAPLFGLTSTMIVTGRMSFFSDALGHSAFTGIAIGCICGAANPTWVAVVFSILFYEYRKCPCVWDIYSVILDMYDSKNLMSGFCNFFFQVMLCIMVLIVQVAMFFL